MQVHLKNSHSLSLMHVTANIMHFLFIFIVDESFFSISWMLLLKQANLLGNWKMLLYLLKHFAKKTKQNKTKDI